MLRDAATITDIGEFTPELLSELLLMSVAAVEAVPLGIGNSSGTCRLVLSYEPGSQGPATLIAKYPSSESAVSGANASSYRAEVGFYGQVASRIQCASPYCYHAAFDEQDGSFLLLLEDVAAVPGEQISGCTVEQARAALVNLAGLHASTWCDPAYLDLPFMAMGGAERAGNVQKFMVELTPGFIERFGISGRNADIFTRYAEVMGELITGRGERFALLHNDYRLDNLLFDPSPASERPVVAVDWAVLGTGLPGRDVAFFLATALDPEERRLHERELVRAYNEALNRDGPLQTLEETFDDYVYSLFQAVMITVIGAMISRQSERGDRMFKVMIERATAAIIDLNGMDTLPSQAR